MSGAPVLVAVGLLAHGRGADGRPRYVLTRRRADAHLGGAWELPGGKVEPGEDPAAALARELAEELGVTLAGAPEPLTFSWHAYPARTVLLLFLEAETAPDSPAPRPLAADALALLTLDELLATPMPAANAPLLRLLAARRGAAGSQEPIAP